MTKRIIYSDSFIEFLQSSDSVIAQFLWRLNRKRYKTLLAHNDEINYITFRGDGNISFLPKGKEHLYNDNGTWKRENRQHGKPAKVIRKLFSARALQYFKDADFEAFANQYKSKFNDDGYKFELLGNDKIKEVYDMERCSGDGSLNGSCMNGDSKYLDIYESCDKLRILTLTNKKGLLCGRALVWKINDNITFLDRFYVCYDFMYDKFINYATEQKWWRKVDYKSYSNKMNFINGDGESVVFKEFKISTDTDFAYYPYIDTFQYGDDGFLSNMDNYKYTYSDTGGGRIGGEDEHEGEQYDEINDCWISDDDAVYIEDGERRYRDITTHVDNCRRVNETWYHEDDENICEVNGEYYLTDSEYICEIDGDYYMMDDCVYCERDSCYYLSEDCVYCEVDVEDVLRSEAVEIDGNWYHVDSDLIFEHNGKYYLVDSGTEK
jgi:hypothetical protein